MKRTVSILLTVMLLISVTYAVSADTALAYDADDLTYEVLADGNVAVTGYKDDTVKVNSKTFDEAKAHSLTIPAKVMLDSDGNYSSDGTEYTVTRIGKCAFGNIGTNQIRDLNLTELTLPYTLTAIGDFAFGYCTYLKNVNVILEDGTLSTTTLFPPALTSLGTGVFKSCDSLSAEVVFPGTLRATGNGTFENDINIKKVTINEGVQIISNGSFYNVMGGTVTSDTIVIPKSVKEFNADAFTGTKIKSIVFAHEDGDSLEKVGEAGVNRNVNVWKGDISTAGGCLGGFYRTSGYTKFYSASASVLKALQSAYGSKMSTDTYADKGMTYKEYYLNNNFILSDSSENTEFTVGDYKYCNAKMTWSDTEDADAPDFTAELIGFSNTDDTTVKDFDASALSMTQGETEYKFEIDSVADSAFKKTNWLRTFKATDRLEKIGGEAFNNCNLEDVSLGNKITSIGINAFNMSSIGYLIIPESVKNYNISGEIRKLRYLIYDGDNLPNNLIPAAAIGGQMYGDCYVCVRADALSAYNTANATSYKDGDVLKASALNKNGETANIVLKVLTDKPIADYLSRGDTYRKAFVYNPSPSSINAVYAAADFGSDLQTYKNCYFNGNITVEAGRVWTSDTAASGFVPAVDGRTRVKVMLFDSIENLTPLMEVRLVKVW